jgi:hypothetical protein
MRVDTDSRPPMPPMAGDSASSRDGRLTPARRSAACRSPGSAGRRALRAGRATQRPRSVGGLAAHMTPAVASTRADHQGLTRAQRRGVPTCLGAVLLLVSVSTAWANDVEKMAMVRVRLSTDATTAAGCTRVGRTSDDSVKDLRRKIVRAGGNTGIVSFGVEDLSMIYADVFQCTSPATAPPASKVPPDIPPPPAGTPPPPPPGPSR